MKKIYFITIYILLLCFNHVNAQEIPKKELRATWLTTVWGLDWPSSKISQTGNKEQINRQKNDLKTILDSVEKAGLNAVFFQVRSECDAMYQSSYEPWSAHLVSSRGLNPGYDPLKFAIEKAHKRGLELHAWINPYRFESSVNKYAGQPGDYSQTNPSWVLDYENGGAILDPGNPEARKRIADIVSEIVQNYNVDGIIFDDYFYAYGGTPYSLDSYSQSKWRPAGKDLHDWRRENVNKMVEDVNNAIKTIKPWVRFGLSPFGIWTTDSNVAAKYGLTLPEGISGLNTYKSIYCDPVAWLQEKTVDYISPQIYWPTTSSRQNYGKLSHWWSDVAHHFERHLYVSHSLANLDESDYTKSANITFNKDFDFSKLEGLSLIEYTAKVGLEKSSTLGYDPSEYGKQINYNRTYDKNDAPGSVFFRTIHLFKRGFINYLLTHEYQNKALPPLLSWYGFKEQSVPTSLQITDNIFSWDYDADNLKYTVYAIPNDKINEKGNFTTGKYLIGISYTKTFNLINYSYLLSDHTLAVAVLDKFGNEFSPTIMGMEAPNNQSVNLIDPINNKAVYADYTMSWSSNENAELYILEIATDQDFTSIVTRKELQATSLDLSTINIDTEKTYYWRVFTRVVNAKDKSSAIEQFTIKPYPKPTILYPTNGLENVDVTTAFKWKNYEKGKFFYQLQISKDNNFKTIDFEKDSIDALDYTLKSGDIKTFSTYYARLLSFNDTITTDWSDIIMFSTVETAPSVPIFVNPTENEQFNVNDILIKIKQDKLAKSFTYQWSTSANFPWNKRKQKTVDAPDTTLVLSNLANGIWYIKAKANYANNKSTDWSAAVMFDNLYTDATYIKKNNSSLSAWLSSNHNRLNIAYSIPINSATSIVLTDINGRKIKQLKDEKMNAGDYTDRFAIADLPRGIYILSLRGSWGYQSIKIIK